MNFFIVFLSWIALLSVMFGLTYLSRPATVIKIDPNVSDMLWCIGGVVLLIVIVTLSWLHIPSEKKPK